MTTDIRLMLCGLSALLYVALLIPETFLMIAPPPISFVFWVALQGIPPLLACHILLRRYPAVARQSPIWLFSGGVLGFLAATALEWMVPAVGSLGVSLALSTACSAVGIFLASFAGQGRPHRRRSCLTVTGMSW